MNDATMRLYEAVRMIDVLPPAAYTDMDTVSAQVSLGNNQRAALMYSLGAYTPGTVLLFYPFATARPLAPGVEPEFEDLIFSKAVFIFTPAEDVTNTVGVIDIGVGDLPRGGSTPWIGVMLASFGTANLAAHLLLYGSNQMPVENGWDAII